MISIEAGIFQQQENIVRIVLSSNEIENIDYLAFEETNKLLYLDLSMNKFAKLELKNLYQLQELYLNGNQLVKIENSFFL